MPPLRTNRINRAAQTASLAAMLVLAAAFSARRAAAQEPSSPAVHVDVSTPAVHVEAAVQESSTTAVKAEPAVQETSTTTVTQEAPTSVHVEMAAATEKAEYIGSQTCLTCHAAREEFRKNLHATSFEKAKGIDFEHSCETCHGPGSLHAAAAGDKNNSGFWTIKDPAQMKAAQASATCLQCHTGSKRMHWQGSVHESKNVSCVNCHAMHKPEVNRGKAPLLTKATQAEVCYQCHADKKGQIRKSGHMPLVEGKMGCAACHNPHGSTAAKLMAKNSVPETCYQCHQDKRGPFLWEHPPVRENCLNCHDPHGTHNDYMLATKPPLLCQRCHISTRHPSPNYDANALANNSSKILDQSCLNCHSRIHGSNHPSGKRFTR